MKLFIISRTAPNMFEVYMITGEATRDAVVTEIVDIDLIKTVENLGHIKTKDDWGTFIIENEVKNMIDFLTVSDYEQLEDFTFSDPSYIELMKRCGNAHQLWIHFYRSDLWN